MQTYYHSKDLLSYTFYVRSNCYSCHKVYLSQIKNPLIFADNICPTRSCIHFLYINGNNVELQAAVAWLGRNFNLSELMF